MPANTMVTIDANTDYIDFDVLELIKNSEHQSPAQKHYLCIEDSGKNINRKFIKCAVSALNKKNY